MSTNFGDQDPKFSDWVSQAEAARIKGVSRQAIHKLVQTGRLKGQVIGGHLLVSRGDLEQFQPQAAGRPKANELREIEKIKRLISAWSPEERSELLRHLREEYPIHSLELKLGLPADVILDAIDRSGDLTVRMIRGVIAEAVFDRYVVKKLSGWQSVKFEGDLPVDYLLKESEYDAVKVQVKLQRSVKGRPLLSEKTGRKYRLSSGSFIVETQRTRAGKHHTTGESTRPYRFGEFDILAVSMYPSTQRWDSFLYTVADWLIPKNGSELLLETYQPVPQGPNEDWTDNFETCVSWFRKGDKKTIRGNIAPE